MRSWKSLSPENRIAVVGLVITVIVAVPSFLALRDNTTQVASAPGPASSPSPTTTATPRAVISIKGLEIRPLTATANQYTAFGTHLYLHSDEIIELVAARTDKDEGVEYHSKPALLLEDNRWTATLRVEPIPKGSKDIGEYNVQAQASPKRDSETYRAAAATAQVRPQAPRGDEYSLTQQQGDAFREALSGLLYEATASPPIRVLNIPGQGGSVVGTQPPGMSP